MLRELNSIRSGPGFSVRAATVPWRRIDFARASYRTMHGEIVSDWRRVARKLTWTIRIPANTTARVYVPSAPDTTVTESGSPLEKSAGLRVIGREGNFWGCEAGAGNYTFCTTFILNR
jgi:alpha-L-rhamnosidase